MSTTTSAFVVYDAATGAVLRFGACLERDLELQATEGEAISVDFPEAMACGGRWVRHTDGTFVEAMPSLEDIKYARLQELEAIASIRLNYWQGAGAPEGGLQVDDISTGRINAWATKALISDLTGAAFDLEFWIMEDNSHRTFANAAEFIAFASAAAAYKTAAILRNSTLKQLIRSADDSVTLAAIDLNAGWPS